MITLSQLKLLLVFIAAHLLFGCAVAPQKNSGWSDPFANIPAPSPDTEPLIKNNGSIYQSRSNRLLFNDLKARNPGDLITVILDENTSAAKSASTSSSKDTAIDLPSPTILGTRLSKNGVPLSTSVQSGNVFSGAGDSNQSNSLIGNITVTIVDTTPTGNLVIAGSKLLTLNSGRELISIRGIVRPADITPQNTVVSNLIANAEIVYNGEGLIADSNKAGWLTRVVNSRFWPF